MNDNRYRQIFEDLTRDLFAVAKKHGKRALREAVRDAAKGELLQEDDEQTPDGDVSPEDLSYPDEDVWTLPPAPEDEEDTDDEQDTDDGEETGEDTEEHELSEAAERVLDQLMDRLKEKSEK